MKTIKINIPEWKDLSKWFWDKFCFPRRELVTKWIEANNENLEDFCKDILIRFGPIDFTNKEDSNRFFEALEIIKEHFNKQTKKAIESIMKK